MKIFVTGAGALLGQGILRCIELSDKKHDVITGDPMVLSSGHWLGHKAYIIPKATDPSYLFVIEDIIQKEKVDVLLIGTDVELPLYAANKEYLERKFNLKVVVAPADIIDIANDKWLTAEFLRENGFPYPQSALTIDKAAVDQMVRSNGFPLIAKPVDGARSIGFEIIKDQQRLNVLTSSKNNLVVQEYLDDKEGEFTSGCVVYGGQCKAIVTLRRDLRDGNTYRTYRDFNTSKYDATIKAVAEKLNIEGPCNFQFRIKNGQPVIFEINSRFSGTTPLRSFYGFNEVEAILNYIENGTVITQPELKEGVVMRAWADIFVENNIIEQFNDKKVLNEPEAEYYSFKR